MIRAVLESAVVDSARFYARNPALLRWTLYKRAARRFPPELVEATLLRFAHETMRDHDPAPVLSLPLSMYCSRWHDDHRRDR